MSSGDDSRSSRLNTWIGIIGGLIAILAFFGVSKLTDLGSLMNNDSTQSGATSNGSPPSLSSKVSGSVGGSGQPRLWFDPPIVQAGMPYSINGSGFPSGAAVEIQAVDLGMVGHPIVIAAPRADATGSFAVYEPAVVCAPGAGQSSIRYEATVQGQPVAQAIWVFC